MLCLINKTDMTNNVPYESIQIATVAGDQAGQATFQVIDPGASINLQLLQEVIFIDETATYGSSATAMIPGHNYLANNNFTYGGGNWTTNGSIPSSTMTYPSSGTFGTGAVATLTFSNQVVSYILAGQSITNNKSVGYAYVVPGQTYCLSGTINVTTAFTNAYVMLKISFQDSGNNVLTSQESTHITAAGSQRISVSLVAPANAVTVRAEFGGITTTTTNSGSATFTALQLEAQWFPALYSYPTPICDFLQADCVTLKDGTAARFNRSFCGNITDFVVSYEGNTRTYDVTATALDGWLENSNLLTKSYSSTTDYTIISDALAPVSISTEPTNLASSTPQALAYRNVAVICTGVTTTMQFADATPREVLNAMAGMTGFLFGVDAYYNAFYCPPYYNPASYSFSSSPDNSTTFSYYDYCIEYDGSQLQNVVNVSGGAYQLQVTETWNAQDGSHSEAVSSGNTYYFTLYHAPIAVPSSVVVGGTTLTCLLSNGGAWQSGEQSQCNLQTSAITLNVSCSAGTSISVTYTYNALVYIQAQSPDSIGAFGRPLYSKINDTNLTSNASAATRGEAQLFAYAQPLITIKFKTTKMVTVGQVITFTSALDNLTNAHFAVQKVTATCLGAGINQYEVEAGTYIDDFVDFFRNTQKATNRASHDPAEPLKQFNNILQDSLSLSDSLNIHT